MLETEKVRKRGPKDQRNHWFCKGLREGAQKTQKSIPKRKKTALHRILLEIYDLNGNYAEFVEIYDFGDLDPSQNVDIP